MAIVVLTTNRLCAEGGKCTNCGRCFESGSMIQVKRVLDTIFEK